MRGNHVGDVMLTNVRRRRSALIVLVSILFTPAVLRAASPLEIVEYSPDVATVVGADATVLRDADVAADDLAGNVVRIGLGAILDGVDVSAYHAVSESTVLFSVDRTVLLGETLVRPADVVRYDGAAYTIELDGAAAGIPSGAMIDAVTATDTDLVLSFDVTVVLPGPLVIADEDLVRYDGAAFSLHFDGSTAGVPERLDLDAAHEIATTGALLLSFDGSGEIGGVAFDDEDVLEYRPGEATWELAIDTSALHAGFAVADLDAFFANPITGSTTTTTLPVEGTCGDPTDDGAVTASDALFILQTAVGTRTCATCICDVTGDGSITASDALAALRLAVGQPVVPSCEPCT